MQLLSLLGCLAWAADPPVAKTSLPLAPSLPLLIAIYDEYDANMQNNLTVNTSLEAARRKKGEREGRKEGVIQMSALKWTTCKKE